LAGEAARRDDQPLLLYVQFDRIAEPALLNEGFRNTDSPGVADAHRFGSPCYSWSIMDDLLTAIAAKKKRLDEARRTRRNRLTVAYTIAYLFC